MKKNIKLIITMITLTMSLMLLGGCGSKEVKEEVKEEAKIETKDEVKEEAIEGNEVLKKIEENEKLVVGTSADYAPYEFHKMEGTKDTIVGFEMEIAKEIANDLGVELEIVDGDFGGLLAALGAGKVDVIISGMTPNEKRRKSVDFSKVFFTAKQCIVMREDEASSVKSFDDFDGKVIGVQMGSIQEQVAEKYITKAKEIKKVAKIPELLLMLKNNKIDGIVMEVPVAKIYTEKTEGIDIAEIEISDDELAGSAVAIKKNNEELVNKINETVDKLMSEDKIKEFYDAAVELAK